MKSRMKLDSFPFPSSAPPIATTELPRSVGGGSVNQVSPEIGAWYEKHILSSSHQVLCILPCSTPPSSAAAARMFELYILCFLHVLHVENRIMSTGPRTELSSVQFQQPARPSVPGIPKGCTWDTERERVKWTNNISLILLMHWNRSACCQPESSSGAAQAWIFSDYLGEEFSLSVEMLHCIGSQDSPFANK